MKAKFCVSVLLLLTFLTLQSLAINFGDNITIPDNMAGFGGWWGPQEDQEVEPGIPLKGQAYDLEGFVYDNSSLTVVGGYNFWSPPNPTLMLPGDLFMDIDGDVQYGNPSSGGSGNFLEPNVWGYDIVYDIDYVSNTYDVYAIDENTLLRNVLYGDKPGDGNLDTRGSNAWRYESALYPAAVPLFSGILATWDNLADADLTDYGFIDDDYGVDPFNLSHYALQVNMSGLGLADGTTFTAHYTMQCGNDNLMGRGRKVPDGGTTLTLLGAVLLIGALLRSKIVN